MVAIVLGFYWFEWRPSQIRHACSWTKEYVGGEPARSAMTEEEARGRGLLKDCTIPTGVSNFALQKLFTPQWQKDCEKENQRLISVYSKPKAVVPAKLQTRKATNDEYKFCLRDKGL